MHIVIFTGGIVDAKTPVKAISKTADLIIGVDSGVETALSFGIKPNMIIGDMDSIDKKVLNEIAASQAPRNDENIIYFPAEKNETDTELAIEEAMKRGAKRITIFGGIQGDRIDHILANIMLLSQYCSNGVRTNISFVNGHQTLWLKKGPTIEEINGNSGDLLSLIPINGDVTHINTEHLQYALKNETLFFGKPRGMSNVLTEKKARVQFEKGTLVFVHTSK